MTPTPQQPDDALSAVLSVIENPKCSCEYVDIGVGHQKVAEDPTCIRCTPFGLADAVLAAVTPVIRRQVAEEAAQAIEAEAVAANWAKTFRNGLEHAAAIARSHSTQPTEEETT